MKVLILANNDTGLYMFRRELIGSILEKHQVVISLPKGDLVGPLVEMGCRFEDTPMDRRGVNPITDMNLLSRYWKLLREEKPDLVIGYTIKPNIYGGIVCRMLGIPFAANITGLGTAFQKKGLLRSLVTALYRVALKRAEAVFFENRDNMKTLLDEKIVAPHQCKCLNGAGVNLEHYAYAEYPREEPVRFLFMGRVMAEKGINELLEAMRRLRRDGFGCTLDVLGMMEESYEQQLGEAQAEGLLTYHGHQSDVRPFVERAHCFVLPSWHEGMANTNLECASMGRPLITSDIPGCREAVLENISGILCKPKDADSLYDAMRRFLDLTAQQRRAMGVAGRIHMERVFDKSKVVRQTLDTLKLGDRKCGKKICLIATVPMTVRSFLIPIAKYYRENTDWDISLMCDVDPGLEAEIPEGVRYIPVRMRRGVDWTAAGVISSMAAVFKREKFDLVQYCTPNASFYASAAARMAKIPVRLYCQWGMVYVSMKGPKRWIFRSIEKMTCRNSTWIEPDSFGNLEFSHREGLYPACKGSVVWNGSTGGIDLARFDLSRKAGWREEIRRKHGIPQGAVVFGFVGRITGDKGINELYEAFRELLKRRPDAYLMMIGGAERQKTIRSSLQEWAEREPHVVFCGPQNGIERYYAAMDVHVLPSYREGFGSVIIEAEAMEIPVIATAIPGPLEAMAPGVTGLSVKKADVGSLLDAMEKLCDDSALRARLGQAGRSYVAERFEINRFYEATMTDRMNLMKEVEEG